LNQQRQTARIEWKGPSATVSLVEGEGNEKETFAAAAATNNNRFDKQVAAAFPLFAYTLFFSLKIIYGFFYNIFVQSLFVCCIRIFGQFHPFWR